MTNGRTFNARASCAGGREFVSQRPTKSNTALQTVRHRFTTSTQVAVLPWRYGAEMGTANSLVVTHFGVIRRV